MTLETFDHNAAILCLIKKELETEYPTCACTLRTPNFYISERRADIYCMSVRLTAARPNQEIFTGGTLSSSCVESIE